MSLRPMSHLHLQAKLKLFIYLGIGIFLTNIPVVYYEITRLNDRLQHLELCEDLYNTILEVRRYEKNYFLYHDADSVANTLDYFKKAMTLYAKTAALLPKGSLDEEISRLGRVLAAYGQSSRFYQAPPSADEDAQMEAQLRSVGKDMVEAAHSLLRGQRRRVARAAKDALRWPLVFWGAMFAVFLLAVKIIFSDVVKPFGMIESAMDRVAKGDFSPIAQDSKSKNPANNMVVAFNRMAEELESREEQIIHSRKVASLGTLVSGIAHELNNPINNIVLSADVLTGKRPLPEERRRQLVDDILRQALRASEIVKNLLEFSRAQTSAHTEFDLNVLLHETLRLAENQIKLSQVRLIDEIEDDLPRMTGNRQGLQQVFLNLITNAVHAMEHGGVLTIRAARAGERKIRVQVQDTGTGIPDEVLPHIFDPFFTTKEVGKGTGLGLSVSYGIIKKHGGQITVKSSPGCGTLFTIDLPVQEKPPVSE